jgi:hypothetical protein
LEAGIQAFEQSRALDAAQRAGREMEFGGKQNGGQRAPAGEVRSNHYSPIWNCGLIFLISAGLRPADIKKIHNLDLGLYIKYLYSIKNIYIFFRYIMSVK